MIGRQTQLLPFGSMHAHISQCKASYDESRKGNTNQSVRGQRKETLYCRVWKGGSDILIALQRIISVNSQCILGNESLLTCTEGRTHKAHFQDRRESSVGNDKEENTGLGKYIKTFNARIDKVWTPIHKP